MPGEPTVVGDFDGLKVKPKSKPTMASYVFGGGVRVFVRGRPPALLPGAVTTLGPVVAAANISLRTFVEARPVILKPGPTVLATGWHAGTPFGLPLFVLMG